MERYANTSGGELEVYADSSLSTKVGKLYRGSACSCLLKHEDTAVVLYRVSSGEYKVGFTGYIDGVQEG